MARSVRNRASRHRIRRSAEAARTALLDAAERRLIAVGPGGIRLKDVAREAGVSHPTVLHHFGSREALVEAVVTRAFTALDAEVLEALASSSTDEAGAGEVLDRVFRVMAERGHARVLAWLALSSFRPKENVAGLGAVILAVHQRRCAIRAERGGSHPTLEDTRFTVLLSSFALFGLAITGDILFEKAGSEDVARAGARFRSWLGKLLVAHLDQRS